MRVKVSEDFIGYSKVPDGLIWIDAKAFTTQSQTFEYANGSFEYSKVWLYDSAGESENDHQGLAEDSPCEDRPG